MSAYHEYEVEFTDRDALIAALQQMNNRSGQQFTEGQIEVHETAQPLFGYAGKQRAERANIIIRRQHVGGAANDVGFEQVGDKMVARISAYDRSHYNEGWMTRLKQEYGANVVEKKAEAKGYQVERKRENGAIKMKLVRWTG